MISIFNKRKLPLTERQIEICDFLLRHHHNENVYALCYKNLNVSSSYEVQKCTYFLNEWNLIISADPLMLTINGAKYSNKGIVKYIRIKRRNEFIKSPSTQIWFVIIAILISLLGYIASNTRANTVEGKTPSEQNKDSKPSLLLKDTLDIDSNPTILEPIQGTIESSIDSFK